jgi:hypothetical protein
MRVVVKLFDKPIELEVEPQDTIGDVKSKIKEKENIDVEMQRIVYNKKPLDADYKTLDECKIKPNSVLKLMLRLFINSDESARKKGLKC